MRGIRNPDGSIREAVPGELMGIIATNIALTAAFCYFSVQGARALDKYINQPVIGGIERADIHGDSGNEEFVRIDGKTFYSEIDGKSVESYLPERVNGGK